ncbi:type III-A CRISPR-associated protein Cas10/Csm1 [Emticicia sp. 17c]|uniref:type III-A CRISPR-associated protein Cas10/Csm1 n=1 Tax=Emticicia sp. 17c TaxID=3127704 RepID=UPI00301BC7E3
MPENTQNKLLVKGDLSGIQEFIFNTKSKGAAKTLKGKSFYVQILADLAIVYIKKKLDGYQITEIYNGGGNFFLLIPDTPPIKEQLANIEKNITRELKEKGLMLILTSVSYLEEKTFGENLQMLNKKALEKSLNRFCNIQDAHSLLFLPEKTIKDNEDFGKEIGEKIIKQTPTNQIITHFDEVFTLQKYPHWINSINLQVPKWRAELKTIFSAIDTDIETGEHNEVVSFEHLGLLAKSRTGTDNLGILKLDLDGLGTIIRDKVKTIEENKNLSELLSAFFNTKLKKLISEKTLPESTAAYRDNVSVIFAGGDDAFIIGAWDAMIHLTTLIQDEFESFFNAHTLPFLGNNKFTFSAGLVFVSPTFPVSSFAILAEEALAKAKKYPQKNALTIFNYTIEWEQWKCVIKETKEISEAVKNKTISRSIIARLKRIHLVYEEVRLKRFQITTLTRFIYELRAEKPNSRGKYFTDSLKDKYKEYLDEALKKEGQPNAILVLPIAARLAEFTTRNPK